MTDSEGGLSGFIFGRGEGARGGGVAKGAVQIVCGYSRALRGRGGVVHRSSLFRYGVFVASKVPCGAGQANAP